MIGVQEVRKRNVSKLITYCGSVVEFSRKINRPNSLVSAIVGKKASKNVGERLARHIEKSFNLRTHAIDCSYFIVPGRTVDGVDFEELHEALVHISLAASDGRLTPDHINTIKFIYSDIVRQ